MKNATKIASLLAVATVLSGCIDDLITDPADLEAATEAEILSGSSGSSGGVYTILPSNYQCPSSCTLANAGANDQTAALCDGARVAYNQYVANADAVNLNGGTVCEGSVCVGVPELNTLYSQFQAQNQLAGDFFNQVGC